MDPTRPSGIDVVGPIHWGKHICLIYETRNDLFDAVVPFFKAGLASGELCLWAVSDPVAEDEAKKILIRADRIFERHLADGGMEVFSARDWYLTDEKFDPA